MSEFNITPAQKAAITRAVNSLNKVRAELEKDNPDYEIVHMQINKSKETS